MPEAQPDLPFMRRLRLPSELFRTAVECRQCGTRHIDAGDRGSCRNRACGAEMAGAGARIVRWTDGREVTDA